MAQNSESKLALNFFDRLDENNGTKIFKCKLCGGSRNGNKPSNLVVHLKNTHNAVYLSEIKRNTVQPDLLLKLKRLELLQICVELTTINKQPFAHILHSAFQKLISEKLIEFGNAGIALDLKSANLTPVKNHLRHTASRIRGIIAEEIKNKPVSISTDIVSKNNRGILGVYSQFLKSGKLVVRCMAMKEMHERHTGAYICGMIESIMVEYGSGLQNILSMTTDNAANMYSLIKNVNQKLENEIEEECCSDFRADFDSLAISEQNGAQTTCDELDTLLNSLLPSEADWTFTNYDSEEITSTIKKNNSFLLVNGINCAAHTIQLAFKEALSELPEDMKNIVVLCREFCKFTHKQNTIYEMERKGLEKRLPPLDVPTRWSSTYVMVNKTDSII